MSKRKFEKGDAVRVILAGSGKPGPTLYAVESVEPDGFGCEIFEIGARRMKPQRFDTSLLLHGDAGDQRVVDIKLGKHVEGPKLLGEILNGRR